MPGVYGKGIKAIHRGRVTSVSTSGRDITIPDVGSLDKATVFVSAAASGGVTALLTSTTNLNLYSNDSGPVPSEQVGYEVVVYF